MSITTCPTDLVRATPQRVWELLVSAKEIARWSASKLVLAPDRPLVPGDQVVLAPGYGLRATLDILGQEPLRELRVDAHLPFGVVNHEVIRISPAGEGQCRVTLN